MSDYRASEGGRSGTMSGDGIRDVWKRGCCFQKGSDLDTLIIEYCLLTIWFPLKHKCPEVDVYHWHEAEKIIWGSSGPWFMHTPYATWDNSRECGLQEKMGAKYYVI